MESVQQQLDTLKGETLALQMILGSLCTRLYQISPQTGSAVRAAFDDAAGFAEQIAIACGETASPQHTVEALRIVEKMRAVAVRDHHQPRHGV